MCVCVCVCVCVFLKCEFASVHKSGRKHFTYYIIAVCLLSVEVSMSYHNFSLLFSFIVISAHVEVVTQLTKLTSYSQLLFHIVVVQCNLSVCKSS